jgi:hypothetical protein
VWCQPQKPTCQPFLNYPYTQLVGESSAFLVEAADFAFTFRRRRALLCAALANAAGQRWNASLVAVWHAIAGVSLWQSCSWFYAMPVSGRR